MLTSCLSVPVAFGQKAWLYCLFIEGFYLVTLLILSFHLKQEPVITGWSSVMVTLLFISIVMTLLDEVVIVWQYWTRLNNVGIDIRRTIAQHSEDDNHDAFPKGLHFRRNELASAICDSLLNVISCALSLAVCWLLKDIDDPSVHQVASRYGEGATSVNFPEVVWALLTAAVGTQMIHFFGLLVGPFRYVNSLWRTLIESLQTEVFEFLKIFAMVMVSFYSMLFIIYPRAGKGVLPLAPDFNAWWDAMHEMLVLAFLGEPITLNLQLHQWETVDDQLSTSQMFDFGARCSVPAY
jgi:hypothetical protein